MRDTGNVSPAQEGCTTSYDDIKKAIRGLTKAQRRALDRICCGDDSRLNPRTVEVLIEKGLVEGFEQSDGAFVWIRYDVSSIAVHMAWAEVGSEEYAKGGAR